MRITFALLLFFAIANFGTTQTGLRPTRVIQPQITDYNFANNIAPSNSGQTWTLPNVPVPGSENCRDNGLGQHPGKDYSINGAVITSAYWNTSTDDILCDYRY